MFIYSIIAAMHLSSAIEIVRLNDRVTLQDKNCSVVNEAAKALKQWRDSVTPGVKECAIAPRALKPNNGLCTLDVHDCLPEGVKKLHGLKPVYNGQNCFNLSLKEAGILPSLRTTQLAEISFYMRPPLCEAVRDNQPKRPGDIRVIKERKDGTDVHGFIYINKDLAFSKNGYEKEYPFALTETQQVLNLYHVKDQSDCKVDEGSLNQKCNEVFYFRCQSFEDYLKKNPALSSEVLPLLKTGKAIESCQEDATLYGQIVDDSVRKMMDDFAGGLIPYVFKNIKNENQSDHEKFLLGVLLFRAQGIAYQNTYLKVENPPRFDLLAGAINNLSNAFLYNYCPKNPNDKK